MQAELLRICAETGDERRVRHPLDPRGGVPLRPRRRDVAAAGPDHPRSSTSTSAADRDDDTRENAALLREDHRGARGAARATRSTTLGRRGIEDRLIRAVERRSRHAPACAAIVPGGRGRRSCSASAFLALWELAVIVFDVEAVLPAARRRRSGRRSSTTSRSSADAAVVSGHATPSSASSPGTLLGVADELPADALPPAQRHAQPAGRRRSTRSRSSCSCRCSTTVRQHLRDAAAAHGDAGRLLHRARQRRQGPAPGARRRTSSCCARTPRRRAQVLRKARIPNAVPYLFTAIQHRRPDRRDHGVRRRVLRRPAERARLPHHVEPVDLEERRGVGLRARRLPARAGRSTWSPSCWRTSPHTGAQPRGGTT